MQALASRAKVSDSRSVLSLTVVKSAHCAETRPGEPSLQGSLCCPQMCCPQTCCAHTDAWNLPGLSCCLTRRLVQPIDSSQGFLPICWLTDLFINVRRASNSSFSAPSRGRAKGPAMLQNKQWMVQVEPALCCAHSVDWGAFWCS